MANLAETATYDAGVYQLETADPVAGGATGVANTPLKNLANRTKYLKAHVDALETAAGGYAPLASPSLTGSPTAPTQALGDNSTKLATDAFVQATVGGRLSKSVSGNTNVTLTAVEAGHAILEFTGVLTGSISVIVPTSPTKAWIIRNLTSGAYTLTVKTAAGTGVVCAQSKHACVFTDGTNVYDSLTDFDSPTLTGTPTVPTATAGTNTTQAASTAFVSNAVAGINLSAYAPLESPSLTGNPAAPTPPQFDSDTSIATTEFVQRSLGNFRTGVSISSASTLLASDAGKSIVFGGSSDFSVQLPLLSGVPDGAAFYFVSNGSGSIITISTQGSDVITKSGATSVSSIQLKNGDSLSLVKAAGSWRANGGSVQLGSSSAFGSLLSDSGYQKLPSGLILQWGKTGVLVDDLTTTITFPVAFPNACLNVNANCSYAAALVGGHIMVISSVSTADFGLLAEDVSTTTNAGLTAYWFAIGY